MIIMLFIILGLVLILPFTVKWIEENLEYFLFIMGLLSTIVTGMLSKTLVVEILENHLIYLITGAVLIAGFLFKIFLNQLKKMVQVILKKVPLAVFVFFIITVLGLVSSFITAIIASLILVEILHLLPIKHEQKITLAVIACFSIGLGAALTPVGEPLSTIVVSTLNQDFFFLIRELGTYIIPCIVALGLFGAFCISRKKAQENADVLDLSIESLSEKVIGEEESEEIQEEETYKVIFIRAFKIFIFVIALELLGTGFKPLINTYVIHLDSRLLYWLNITSAILDNATLASAEISNKMDAQQIQAILMGLLISGGMLIPGNIPNIISAGKLQIKSKEWAKLGLPIGFVILSVFFLIIFLL